MRRWHELERLGNRQIIECYKRERAELLRRLVEMDG